MSAIKHFYTNLKKREGNEQCYNSSCITNCCTGISRSEGNLGEEERDGKGAEDQSCSLPKVPPPATQKMAMFNLELPHTITAYYMVSPKISKN